MWIEKFFFTSAMIPKINIKKHSASSIDGILLKKDLKNNITIKNRPPDNGTPELIFNLCSLYSGLSIRTSLFLRMKFIEINNIKIKKSSKIV